MTTIASSLAANPWTVLGSLAVGAIGIVLSFYFYLRPRIDKRPAYAVHTLPITGERFAKLEAVQVTHRGKGVPSLSLTRIALWNKGRTPLDAGDVAPLDPIRINVVEGVEILDAQIRLRSTEANNFQVAVSSDSRSATVTFDYFAHNEGIVVQLLHTGRDQHAISVSGTIKHTGHIKFSQQPDMPVSEGFINLVVPTVINNPKSTWARRVMVTLAFALLPILIPLALIDLITQPIWRAPKAFRLQ